MRPIKSIESHTMSIPFLRSDRYALEQLFAAIKSGEAPDVKGCKEASVILDAWGTLESSRRESQSRISQLENELEAARELLHESAASASTYAVRFDLVNRASSEGLWDMEVVAGDPINPKNRFWWSQQFRNLLGFKDERDFPNVLASWADRLHQQDKRGTLDAFARHLNDKSGNTPYEVRNRLAMKDGSYRWFHAQGNTS